MTIGERIKKRRQQLGLSVDQVAEALNKNRATVYRYESSYIEKLPTTVLEPLSKVLQTTPAYLMGWMEKEGNSVDIGKRIKQRREELGMSQEELAQKAGYTSRSSISKIEKDANGMTQRKLASVAKALNTTPSYLMGWDDEEEPPTHEEKAIADIIIKLGTNEKFLNLVETLNEYPEERIDAISAMISAFEK